MGVKAQNGQKVSAGQIIVRQRGTKYVPGRNVGRGADDTLYALVRGVVRFLSRAKIRFDGSRKKTTVVAIEPN